jgi:hypothetical protein
MVEAAGRASPGPLNSPPIRRYSAALLPPPPSIPLCYDCAIAAEPSEWGWFLQILIHLFCAHMDGLLPADPRSDKSKPFSSLYYVLAPKSPGSYTETSYIYIYDA